MDFTQTIYKRLVKSLLQQGFSFQPFSVFIENPLERVVVLRHDVDLKPQNSLLTAQIEHELGIVGSYYFRIVKESNVPEIIKQIAELGHEIGYHYENMDTVSQNAKRKTLNSEQIIDAAYEEFCRNLEYFRTFYPVKTICMHGSPLSKYDNKDIWKKYDYKSLGLIGEPYFDIDFDKVFYLTDTGRRWDGERVSVRDKVQGSRFKVQGSEFRVQSTTNNYSFKHTKDIIKVLDEGHFPNQVMITVHPQRWNDAVIPWTKELVMQNVKNVVKRILIKRIHHRSLR